MLTQDELTFFEHNGYLVVENVLDQKTVLDPVRHEYSELMDELYVEWHASGAVTTAPNELDFHGKLLEAYKAGCDWFQPMDISLPGERVTATTPMHFGPAVFNMLRAPRLLDIVEQLIGSEITSNPIQHVRIKPPAINLHKDEVRAHITATDWHQDRGVALDEADQTAMVTIWCAVSDATPENGCLQVIPGGAHRGDLLPHCPRRQTAIAEGFIDESQAIPLPVKSGGIVIFHPLVPHASLENRTQGFRWSFDIRYNRTGEPTGRSHFPEFVARSRSQPTSELQDWREWKGMWETARSVLARQDHIDLHRWSGNAPFCA